MSKRSGIQPVARRAARGFSLIEMMIAMVLGLLVVGAAIGIFVSNQQAYRATEGLGRVQENVRMAFEMMRDRHGVDLLMFHACKQGAQAPQRKP